MNFKVLAEFQHGGIVFEPGNTHTKHGLSDETVMLFYGEGWVSVDGTSDAAITATHKDVQLSDIKIVLNQGGVK
jgi:hypothetical protein